MTTAQRSTSTSSSGVIAPSFPSKLIVGGESKRACALILKIFE